jgi:ferrous iron transport protein B
MGTIILIASIVVWFLGYFPRNAEGSQYYDNKIIKTEETYNEQIAAQIFYVNVISLSAERDELITSYKFEKERKHQEQSYIGRCGKFIEPLIRPLGFNWKIGIALVSGVAAKEIVVSTLSVLYTVDTEDNEKLSARIKADTDLTPLVAISLMVFILLYFPCFATITAISKESGRWKWGIFTICYTIMLAWIVSFIIYQVGLLII